MLPFLEDLRKENFDCISFLPGEQFGELQIEGGTYIDKGEDIMGKMGCIYHINIFKERDDFSVDFDSFEAVLSDPLVYLSHIIKSGFYGFVSKKTTTSNDFNQDMVQQLKESLS